MKQQEIYKKNRGFFESQYAGIAHQIVDEYPLGEVRTLPAQAKGYYFLESKSAEGHIYPLHSKYDPRREARIWAANQDVAGKRHVLMFGLGLGYQVEALLELYPDMVFYIYEPDRRLFFASLHTRDWTAFPWKHVSKFTLDEQGQHCLSFIKAVFVLLKEDWLFLSIPSFERCYAADFSNFKDTLLKEKDSYLRGFLVNSNFQKEWTINAVKNVPYALQCGSVFTYQELFDQQTVVMVASGPSLDEAIPYLRTIKEKRKAIILCIGSSLNVLLGNDLMPDLHISYDPAEINYIDLAANLEKGVPLIFGSTIRHEVVQNHKGPKAYFVLVQDTVLPFLTGVVPKDQILNDAASIAVPALDLLNKLKVKRVIFAGQDLAYYQDKMYSHGADIFRPEGETSPEEKKEYVEVLANNGETVFTSPVFNIVRTGMEEIIARGQFSAVFNPAVHGAKIAGSQHISWESIVEMLPDEGFSKGISFAGGEGGRPIRKMRKSTLAMLDRFDLVLARIYRQMEKLVAMDEQAGSEVQETQYNLLNKELLQMTASQEYESFVFPMIRNEDHVIKKFMPDFPRMALAEKKEVVNNQFRKYLSGVRLSLLKLRDAVNEWK